MTLALLGVASAASAQTIPSPYRYVEQTQSAGPFAGYVFTDRGEHGTGPHSGPLFGARYAIRFAGPVSGEAAIGAMPTRRTVFQRVTLDEDSAELRAVGDVSAFVALAEAGLRLNVTGPRTWRGLAPYLTGSAGFATDLVNDPALEEEIESAERVEFGPSFAVGLGAGTDWFLSERFSLRLELRDHLWRLTTPQALIGRLQEETEWTHNVGITIGAALHFGG